MPITIAICDDEILMRESLMRLVKSHSDNCHVDLYASGDALLTADKDYDIYFLDIQMPGLNGIETAERLRARKDVGARDDSVIIFVTALKEYMQDAFDVKAFHYLLKPIEEAKFKLVFSRATADCKLAKQNIDNHIIIKTGNTYHKIFSKDIFYVESRDKKLIVNSEESAIEYYGKIGELENTLGNSFFRCHRGYLVNMEHISRYNASAIWLKNGDTIHLAHKKYQEFVKAFMAFARGGGLV